MPLVTRDYDAARYLDSDEALAAYIADATESGDAQEPRPCAGRRGAGQGYD